MLDLLLIAIMFIVLAVGMHLSRQRAIRARQLEDRRAVDSALDLSKDPETPWVDILVNARKTMPADQYEKFERAVMDLVHNINVVNRSGLKSRKEKWDMLEKLTKGPSILN